jgi:hypothetical protein
VCGACGSGGGLPRWEDRIEPATRRVLAARARLASRLLEGDRLRVTAWGTGYVLNDGRGASTVAADLDTLWRACARSRGQLVGWPGGTAEAEVELDPRLTAVPGLLAVWSAAVAHLAGLPGPLHLSLPDPERDGSLLLGIGSSAVHVEVTPGRTAVPVLAGPGATSAAAHLLAAAALPEPSWKTYVSVGS